MGLEGAVNGPFERETDLKWSGTQERRELRGFPAQNDLQTHSRSPRMFDRFSSLMSFINRRRCVQSAGLTVTHAAADSSHTAWQKRQGSRLTEA